MLKMNSQGATVWKLQGMLRKLGYAINDRPGFFGADTRGAVIDIQSSNGLRPVGVAGHKVLKLIKGMLLSQADNTTPSGGVAYIGETEKNLNRLEAHRKSGGMVKGLAPEWERIEWACEPGRGRLAKVLFPAEWERIEFINHKDSVGVLIDGQPVAGLKQALNTQAREALKAILVEFEEGD